MSVQHGRFPFGQPVEDVVQQDRAPKKVFVLGVYASAVHARWVGPGGKDLVKALAVASEPRIFWQGAETDTRRILKSIEIPEKVGRLEPAASKFNGPSGVALDDRILRPLGLERDQAWLCDLVPHSCVNPAQARAIEKHYDRLARKLGLPEASAPALPKPLVDDARREAILRELSESKAEVLSLLGDLPIRWFMRPFDKSWKRLADFEEYGRLQEARLDGLVVLVLPLAHPRQVAQLGRSSQKWFDEHERWVDRFAPGLLTGARKEYMTVWTGPRPGNCS